MSKFNTKSAGTKTVNYAGGKAFKESAHLELISILLTSFGDDKFYRSAEATYAKIRELIPQCKKEFVAKAAIYARTKFGMRTITHVVASELAKYIGGEVWAKDFYREVIYRPDDMMEILSYHTQKNGKVPNSMKKGFAMAFDKFDKYGLAKYRGEGKAFKLVDVVNLVHPVPHEKNAEAIAALVKGELKSFDTWESELTAAGQLATNDDEKAEFKKDVWTKLIREKKIKYFALLRNLRNILEQAPDMVGGAIKILLDEQLVRKSLVMPFRFITAFEEIQKTAGDKKSREILVALSAAVDISLANVPVFEGETLVVLDTSSSMTTAMGSNLRGFPAKIGSLFAAVLVKANNCDLMTFDSTARYLNLNPADTTISMAANIGFRGGDTRFNTIFPACNKKYDRVIILSDMQGWGPGKAPTATFEEYKKKFNADPFVHSFDLAGYGTLQFPQNKVAALAGFSDKTMNLLGLLEQDKNALVNEIQKITL